MLERIRAAAGNSLAWVFTWSLPLRFLASAALGALVGSGVVSGLLEYATHAYALAYGFRPPVEGVPYLRATVAAASFAMALSGAAIAAWFIALFRTRKQTGSYEPSKFIWLLILTGVVSLGGFIYVNVGNYQKTGLWSVVKSLISLAGGVCFAAWFTPRAEKNPQLTFWLAAVMVLLYYIAVAIVVFTPSSHARMLRLLGFGGGYPIDLVLEGDHPAVKGYLLLRSSSVAIVYRPEEQMIYEYPLDKVHHFAYSVGSLRSREFALPDEAGH